MATRRTTLKGRGADVFFSSDDESQPAGSYNSTTVHQHTGIYPKATYYLPQDLQQRLDDHWIERRRANRKLTKSEIVRQALESYLIK